MKKRLSILLLTLPMMLVASISPQKLFPTVLSSSMEIKLNQTIALKKTTIVTASELLGRENCIVSDYKRKKRNNHKTYGGEICELDSSPLPLLGEFTFVPTTNNNTLSVKKRQTFTNANLPSLIVDRDEAKLVFKAPLDSNGKRVQHIGKIVDRAYNSNYTFHEGDYYIDSIDIESNHPKKNDTFFLKTKGKVRIFLNNDSKIIKRADDYKKRGYIELNYKRKTHNLVIFSKKNLLIDASRRLKMKGFIYGYSDVTLISNINATLVGAVTAQGKLTIGKESPKHWKQEKSGEYIYDEEALGKIGLDFTTTKNSIEKLILSAKQTNFIRQKDVIYKNYQPIRGAIKVMAVYGDGDSEEVTDQVKWIKSAKTIGFGEDYFRASKGIVKVSASLDGVISNEIVIDVKDEPSKILWIEKYIEGREANINITLPKRPTKDIHLTFRVKREDAIGLGSFSPHLIEKKLTITPQRYDDSHTRTGWVYTKNIDKSSTADYTIIIDPIISEDPFYDGKDPEDILIKYTPKTIKLTAPSLQERRGAIRGVPVLFRVTTEYKGELKYKLINPPKGMKFIDDPTFHLPNGKQLRWDVPMDAKEGKIYPITVEAEDEEGNKAQISFDIKVPKTKAIPTEIVNNELIVTDKSSPLYGMKMKGHNGEDISTLRIRSVDYKDVWKKYIKKENPNDVMEMVVFVVDDMVEMLDVKMPNWMNTKEKIRNLDMSFFQYDKEMLYDVWTCAVEDIIEYENRIGFIYKKQKSTDTNIFMLILKTAQNKGN